MATNIGNIFFDGEGEIFGVNLSAKDTRRSLPSFGKNAKRLVMFSCNNGELKCKGSTQHKA